MVKFYDKQHRIKMAMAGHRQQGVPGARWAAVKPAETRQIVGNKGRICTCWSIRAGTLGAGDDTGQ